VNYVLWFLLGFFTYAFVSRFLTWQAKKSVSGDGEFNERLRAEFIGKMDHDRLLRWRDAISSELERRKVS
jgi:hypothetical protein